MAKFGRVIPSMAFVHIPIYASETFQLSEGVDPNEQPGINDAMPMAQQAYSLCSNGVFDTSCAYGGQDDPFMRAIANDPGMASSTPTNTAILGVTSGTPSLPT